MVDWVQLEMSASWATRGFCMAFQFVLLFIVCDLTRGEWAPGLHTWLEMLICVSIFRDGIGTCMLVYTVDDMRFSMFFVDS